jgi:hypothetical protein
VNLRIRSMSPESNREESAHNLLVLGSSPSGSNHFRRFETRQFSDASEKVGLRADTVGLPHKRPAL